LLHVKPFSYCFAVKRADEPADLVGTKELHQPLRFLLLSKTLKPVDKPSVTWDVQLQNIPLLETDTRLRIIREPFDGCLAPPELYLVNLCALIHWAFSGPMSGGGREEGATTQ
jgi:hypothetical protein